MSPQEALELFLSNVLVKSKRDRYLGFVSKRKSQGKFLSAIYHELETCFDQGKKVSSLNEKVLQMPGYKYAPPAVFGDPIETLSEVCNNFDDSFLVISIDGKHAIHGPETFIDSRAFYSV